MTKKKTTAKTSQLEKGWIIFFPMVILTFVLWVLYRALFNFPVWFDETVGKALFFGMPVWVFITVTGYQKVAETFAEYKLKTGLLLGIAVGGVFGFVASIMALLQRGGVVEAAWLFESPQFWQEFVLALFTAFWETLLFYSFIMSVIMDKFKDWFLEKQVFLTALIFLAFHIPNIILRFEPRLFVAQATLLFLFGIGQAYLFASRKNAFALILSHAIWGMVLLVHAW